MKNLKKFEDYFTGSEKIYWMLPTDDRFYSALKKINCSKEFMEKMLRNKMIARHKYVYIGFHSGDYLDEYSWGWVDGDSEYFYKEEGFIYQGEVGIPKYELDANKYNL